MIRYLKVKLSSYINSVNPMTKDQTSIVSLPGEIASVSLFINVNKEAKKMIKQIIDKTDILLYR